MTPLFTLPQQSIHTMSEVDLRKTLTYLNIPTTNKTKEQMINDI